MNLQTYLLVKTIEEANELSHAGCKAVLNGLSDINPKEQCTSLQHFINEFNDMFAMAQMLQDHGIELPGLKDPMAIMKKKLKVYRYMRAPINNGILQLTPKELDKRTFDMMTLSQIIEGSHDAEQP